MENKMFQEAIENLKDLIQDSAFLVEATSCETHEIWRQWSKKLGFVQIYTGCGVCIGTLDNRPLMVTYSQNWYAGSKVIFFEGTSQLVDHKLIEEFNKIAFPHLFPKDERRKLTNADNFHNAASVLQEILENNIEVQKRWVELKDNSNSEPFDVPQLSEILALAKDSKNIEKINQLMEKAHKRLYLS